MTIRKVNLRDMFGRFQDQWSPKVVGEVNDSLVKLVKLQFDGNDTPDDLGRYGEVTRRDGPIAELKVERGRVSEVLAALLDRHTLVDLGVQDPPLDQVIARVFEGAAKPEDKAWG